MKIKGLAKVKKDIENLIELLEEKVDIIDWGKNDSESWESKCQQRDELLSAGMDEFFSILEIIEGIEKLQESDF